MARQWFGVYHEPAPGENLNLLLVSPYLDVAERLAIAWGQLLVVGKLTIKGKALAGGLIRLIPTLTQEAPDPIGGALIV